MAKTSQHPFVFVHGMMGWGEDKKLSRLLPYWGMVTGSTITRARKQGFEAYAPSVSPLGSAWDRACELYAQLTGTRVDYGKAHSAKYGHDRYGMTFTKPFVPDWTPERSIHLLGHSFGGPTMRMFAELMTNGSAEERAVTPEAELSPLFQGGHGDLIKSITAISGPFDGITFPHAMPFLVHYVMTYGILAVASVLGNIGTGHIYDFKMSAWGITEEEGKPRSLKKALNIPLNIPKMVHFAKAQDFIFPDIHIDRAAELNKMLHAPDAYLFCVTGNGTKQTDNGNWVRDKIMFPLFAPFAYILGKYPDQTIAGIDIDDEWRMNDGIVPVRSGRHPSTEPWCEWEEVKDQPLKKGIWHALPTGTGDHGTVIGGSLHYLNKAGRERFRSVYDFWLSYLDQLPD